LSDFIVFFKKFVLWITQVSNVFGTRPKSQLNKKHFEQATTNIEQKIFLKSFFMFLLIKNMPPTIIELGANDNHWRIQQVLN